MAKFIKCEEHGWKGVYPFQCPGCGCAHYVNTIKGEMGNPCWHFNGDVDNPTVSPSILVRYPTAEKMNICHSFVRNGKIEFLSDCTHELAGKTVELENW